MHHLPNQVILFFNATLARFKLTLLVILAMHSPFFNATLARFKLLLGIETKKVISKFSMLPQHDLNMYNNKCRNIWKFSMLPQHDLNMVLCPPMFLFLCLFFNATLARFKLFVDWSFRIWQNVFNATLARFKRFSVVGLGVSVFSSFQCYLSTI